MALYRSTGDGLAMHWRITLTSPVRLAICLMMQSRSIRKRLIRMLGNPPYVLLLMDSASHEIAIMGHQEEIKDCLKVPENLMNDPDVSFMLHARWYIKSVMNLMKWEKKSYRVPCVSIINETIPVFSLDQAVMLNCTDEEL